ncbi:MAG: deoxyribonuclease V [Pseudomonadota bacterium]|nr:deoxyribonuclease V [Pseudomonadota bacterium]
MHSGKRDRPASEGPNKVSFHDWDLPPKQAIALQKELAAKVERHDRLPTGGRRGLKHIAGLDVAFEDGGKITRGAAVVLRLADLEPVASAIARRPTSFPYIPGLLSFREVPVLLDALAMLDITPDILMCDGHGIAHPRRFGIACHLGLLPDMPVIGVAKSRLTGSHDEPGLEKGDRAPLVATAKSGGREERLGAVLRTRSGVKPVYVSTGHRVGLKTALALTMRCATRYRLPEPVRLADKLSKTG